jgi:hypothetical protein
VIDFEWLRLVNAALALSCAGTYGVRINFTWARLTTGVRILRCGIFALFLASAAASAGAYLSGFPVGAWVPLTTIALVVILYGLWHGRNDDRAVP